MEENTWVAWLHVRPLPGFDPFKGPARGAFVYVVGLAPELRRFEDLVHQTLRNRGLYIVEFEEVAVLGDWKDGHDLSSDISEALDNLTVPNPVQWGTFDTYAREDS